MPPKDVVQTTAQTTGGAGVAEDTVETPVAEEQTTPVAERTEGPGLDPDVRAEAEKATEAAKAEAAETSEAEMDQPSKVEAANDQADETGDQAGQSRRGRRGRGGKEVKLFSSEKYMEEALPHGGQRLFL